ncbi:MAG: chromosome partitioning protein ParA, partial [Pseudomonadales bacterium]|nr:chromosome partitioning protein ParA [Pseudomonadales bacterium]
MVDTRASVEAVFCFDENGICKEMMYTEFEAILDGVVGLNEFAGDTIRSAFVVINGALQVESCVLFTIAFDRQGFASKSWNLPLRHLAETAGAGPNLGAGPIRLSCKSQCSVAWHHADMWDPDMTPKGNSFIRIRDTAKANKLCI